MISRLISLVIFVAMVIFGIGYFLQPDDFRKCDIEKPGTNSECQPVDAVVAISGGDTGARTNGAIELFKAGWANKLIFSGAAMDKTSLSNAAVMKLLAIEAGVPEASIYIDEKAESTRQNAENLQSVFDTLEIKKIILVTSGYHQRRASLEFEKYTDGVEVLNHPVKIDKDWSFWWWSTPRGWWLAGSEMLKIVVFSVIGA